MGEVQYSEDASGIQMVLDAGRVCTNIEKSVHYHGLISFSYTDHESRFVCFLCGELLCSYLHSETRIT